jgi:hypothetical protein
MGSPQDSHACNYVSFNYVSLAAVSSSLSTAASTRSKIAPSTAERRARLWQRAEASQRSYRHGTAKITYAKSSGYPMSGVVQAIVSAGSFKVVRDEP